MVRALLTRQLRAVSIAALFFVVAVPVVAADPVTVTSGMLVLPDDDPSYFQFFGTDGLVLGGLFVPTFISPHRTCISGGCAPGGSVDMSAVAGGERAGGSLGSATGAIVNGIEYLRPFRLVLESQQLIGTLRFDAPVVMLPLVGGAVTAPFVFTGDVTAFARDDLDLALPLFHVDLVGHGTVRLAGLFEPLDIEAIYTFSAESPAVPEPMTAILLGTGLIGVTARGWRRKRTAR
jgi:hypothetical protein